MSYDLKILGDLLSQAGPRHYLTAATGLSIPRPSDNIPALWYSSTLSNPESWIIAGRDLASTNELLGTIGLWDATEIIEKYGVRLPIPSVWAADHERSLFDLLINFCEVKSQSVPNIHVSDIDDVVDIGKVRGLVEQCHQLISPEGLSRIDVWISGGY